MFPADHQRSNESFYMDTRIPENPATGQSVPAEEQLEQLNSAIERAKEYATRQAKEADKLIRHYPYQSIGIALGLGLIIGLLAGRR